MCVSLCARGNSHHTHLLVHFALRIKEARSSASSGSRFIHAHCTELCRLFSALSPLFFCFCVCLWFLLGLSYWCGLLCSRLVLCSVLVSSSAQFSSRLLLCSRLVLCSALVSARFRLLLVACNHNTCQFTHVVSTVIKLHLNERKFEFLRTFKIYYTIRHYRNTHLSLVAVTSRCCDF